MTVATPSVTLPSKLEKQIRSVISESFMLPQVAVQALKVGKDPNCRLQDFSAIIERDAKLAAELLASANASVFGFLSPVTSLHQAVLRLGLRECRTQVINASLKTLSRERGTIHELHRSKLVKHGFLTAMICLRLNASLNVGFGGVEFTAGLLHDFGRILLACAIPQLFEKVDPLTFDESSATLLHEQELIQTDHCQAGKWFAVANKLPEILIEVIEHHHHPGHASVPFRQLVALTAAADHMANYIQSVGSPAGYHPRRNDAVILLEQTGVAQATGRFKSVWEYVMNDSMNDVEELEM